MAPRWPLLLLSGLPVLGRAAALPRNARRLPLQRFVLRMRDSSEDGTFALGSFEASDARRRMDDPDVRSRVLRTMVDAMDNFRPNEVEEIFRRLWAAGPGAGPDGVTIPRLMQLSERMHDLEDRYARGEGDPYELGDEARFIRSRVRQYAQDARMYPGAREIPGFD